MLLNIVVYCSSTPTISGTGRPWPSSTASPSLAFSPPSPSWLDWGQSAESMDESTTKTPNPKCRLFFKIDLLTDFAALCLTDFYRLEIRSIMVGIFDPACELLPPWMKELYKYLCTVDPLPFLWHPPPPLPLPKLNVQCIQTVCGCGEGESGGGGCWVVL